MSMLNNGKLKRILCIWLALVTALALVACGSTTKYNVWRPLSRREHKIKVGIINLEASESGYRKANVRDLEERFTAERGYDASFAYSMDNGTQIEMARAFIEDGVEYLLIAAADTAGWNSLLNEAKYTGVKVILFDRMIDEDESLYEASVVSDMLMEGQLAVEYLESLQLKKYKIIHLQGTLGSSAQKGRSYAIEDKVHSEFNWRIMRQETANWDREQAKAIVLDALAKGTTFNVVYSENDDMTKGAVEALDEYGISHGPDGSVAIISFDCNKWAMEELMKRSWNYDGQCNPYQASYLDEIIKTIESGGRLANKTIIIKEKGFSTETIKASDIKDFGI